MSAVLGADGKGGGGHGRHQARSRRTLATVAAIALAAAALWWARSREQPSAGGDVVASSPSSSQGAASAADSAEDEPQSVVWKMVDASKARDVRGYLDCFAGDLRTRLDASVRELGESGFADYLAQRVEELKGVALYDIERAPAGGASVTVEYVFANEKELQRLHLDPSRAGGWRITAADESRREKSLIPYGTPIEQVE
jgi:hypothetical protein